MKTNCLWEFCVLPGCFWDLPLLYCCIPITYYTEACLLDSLIMSLSVLGATARWSFCVRGTSVRWMAPRWTSTVTSLFRLGSGTPQLCTNCIQGFFFIKIWKKGVVSLGLTPHPNNWWWAGIIIFKGRIFQKFFLKRFKAVF